MKKLLIFLMMTARIYSMQSNGPLNVAWFYSDECPYKAANKFMQQQKWMAAAELYMDLLYKNVGTNYDKSMARLNCASSLLAQRKKSKFWTEYDVLCDIKPERRVQENITLQKGTCIIGTDQCGMGDIVHFFRAVEILKKMASQLDVVVAVRKNMLSMLAEPAKVYGVSLVDASEKDSIPGAETHLVSLLGYLHLFPKDLIPEKPLYTTSNLAMTHVKNRLDGIAKKYKRIMPLFLGRKDQATFMGGRKLPSDPKEHGRYLNAQAFEKLLANDKSLLLLDCNPPDIRIIFDKKKMKENEEYLLMDAQFENRVLQLPPDKDCDTIIALEIFVNAGKHKFIGFGADFGPTNIFTRGLSQDAQSQFAYIIPNSKEYDVRMEGSGQNYQHMLSSCWVYKCKTPEEQSDVIMQAYKDMQK